MPEHADDDLLMQGSVELAAAAHVVDRHEVGTDHAGQLYAWLRLADDGGRDQVIMAAAVVTTWSAYIGARS